MCKKEVQGVSAPWGITRACASDACLLAAQIKDKGAKSVSTALALPEKPLLFGVFPQYQGIGICYLGSDKWAVGLMDNEGDDHVWFKDVSWEKVEELVREHSKHCVRQEFADVSAG